MPLAWNEIRHRAIKFANDWPNAASESADKQTFWNEFFDVFGVARKTVASFEAPVKKVSGHDGFIDLFWKGVLIVEHKSLGGNLSKAQSQAFDYIQALASEGKHNEIPRYVIVSDFARIVLYDLEPEEQKDLPLFAGKRVQIAAEFPLKEFHKNIRPFAFIAGYKQQKLDPEDPANLEAAKIMANLHDALKAGNYVGHELRVFLVRILFCLFAEDTGIFPQPRQFELFLTNHTAPDGSDLGLKIARLFEVLNTPEDKRQKHLEADLAEFPYVNGDLFKEQLKFADFNSDMRNALLAACAFRWEKISPAVFGSLFQEVMLAPERRQLGAHYTAEKNIMKVVRSLFLDDFRAELEAIKTDKSTRRAARLDEFHDKLAKQTFFDPACGCGNFLVITYRELRALELDILKLKYGKQTEMKLDEVNKLSSLDVDQMFGIEIEEFPARIAEVALWLTDHQANMELSIAFTQRYLRIPLRKSPHIKVGNALREDWKQLLPPEKCSYILGNPPFVGHQWRTPEQQEDMAIVWGDDGRVGRLDFVTAWYAKASEYLKAGGGHVRVAFVSTNSISQGEQVAIMWAPLFERGMKIDFAHRTFPWESEARGKAHVHVVIIGFSLGGIAAKKVIVDYDPDPAHPTIEACTNINPYLVSGSDFVLPSRTDPRPGMPQMKKGSQPTDGGHLILDEAAKQELIAAEPKAARFLRKYVGSDEMISGVYRWCLWLKQADPSALKTMPHVLARVEMVRESRLKSPTKSVRDFAQYPTLFSQDRQPESEFLAVPEVSSQNRRYIPMAFLSPDFVASNKLQMIVGATIFHFGVLTSAMHMAWIRVVSGRLKSDISYAPAVYNNFPWPPTPSALQKSAVEKAAQAVLDARAQFMSVGTDSTPSHSADGVGASAASITPSARKENSLRSPRSARDEDAVERVPTPKTNCTLADLYDPVAMPPSLRKAHTDLDRAVDRCYRKDPFPSDRARVEYLFQLYEQLTAPLLPATKTKTKRTPSARVT